MYFTVNTVFVNYLDNLNIEIANLLNRATHEQTLPISLQSFDFDSDLLRAPKTVKDFVHYFGTKDIFDLQKGYNNGLALDNKNFFFNNCTIDVLLFVTAIIL